jgi:hypothetical protein
LQQDLPLSGFLFLKNSIAFVQFYGKENGCKACGQNCALCSHIIESTSFKDNEGNTYNIQGSINCKTVGVIYCILCTEARLLNRLLPAAHDYFVF